MKILKVELEKDERKNIPERSGSLMKYIPDEESFMGGTRNNLARWSIKYESGCTGG